MKYIIDISSAHTPETVVQHNKCTLIDESDITKINDKVSCRTIDVIRAFGLAIKDHVNEYRNNHVIGWDDSPIDSFTPLNEYIAHKTLKYLTNLKISDTDIYVIEDVLQSCIYEAQGCLDDTILEIKIYPIQNVEIVL